MVEDFLVNLFLLKKIDFISGEFIESQARNLLQRHDEESDFLLEVEEFLDFMNLINKVIRIVHVDLVIDGERRELPINNDCTILIIEDNIYLLTALAMMRSGSRNVSLRSRDTSDTAIMTSM